MSIVQSIFFSIWSPCCMMQKFVILSSEILLYKRQGSHVFLYEYMYCIWFFWKKWPRVYYAKPIMRKSHHKWKNARMFLVIHLWESFAPDPFYVFPSTFLPMCHAVSVLLHKWEILQTAASQNGVLITLKKCVIYNDLVCSMIRDEYKKKMQCFMSSSE